MFRECECFQADFAQTSVIYCPGWIIHISWDQIFKEENQPSKRVDYWSSVRDCLPIPNI